MLRMASIMATAALLLSADISVVMPLQSRDDQHVQFPPGENLPVLPDMAPDDSQTQAIPNASGGESPKTKDEPLQAGSRLALVRYVDGELARVVQPLPGGKKGFYLKAGTPLDVKALRQAISISGAAVNPGDKAQITRLGFKDRQIIVDVNGGGGGHTRFRDRIHLMVSGAPTMQTPQQQSAVNTNAGATLFLDFDKPLPEMTPDNLKQYLSSVLDFSKQPSAAVHWFDTLPPQMQNAVKEKRPAVGMDRDMVLAAIGKPDRKVRERSRDGAETEDWIYGHPPAKTIFVKFEGDKVIQIEQFPR